MSATSTVKTAESYKAFVDGMEAAAQICGTLAETTYDDADGFEAATGCEASIMGVVREQRPVAGGPDKAVLHLISNASMNVASLENLTIETARTLLIGIAREAQALTGLSWIDASKLIERA